MEKKDQQFVAQKIRSEYVQEKNTSLQMLKALDAKVKRPANIFAYVVGVIGALIMGTGMTLCMDVIPAGTYMGISVGENMMLPGILIGIVGMVTVCVNYPVYKRILNNRRERHAKEILELSDKILKGE